MPPAPCKAGISLSVAIILAGCTTAPFRENVASFATSTKAATQAVSVAERSLADDQAALFRLEVADGRISVRRTGNCGAGPAAGIRAPVASGACRIGPAPGQAIAPAPVAVTDEERQFISAIGGYAEALLALTSATDSEALAKASADFNKAFGDAASAAGPYGAVGGALVQALVWATGLALEQERFSELDRAIRVANSRIETLAPVIGEVLDRLRQARIASLSGSSVVLLAGIPRAGNWADRATRYDLAAERTAELAAMVALNPAKASEDIVAAHRALLAALDDPRLRAQALLPAIQQLAEQATALRTAFAALRSP